MCAREATQWVCGTRAEQVTGWAQYRYVYTSASSSAVQSHSAEQSGDSAAEQGNTVGVTACIAEVEECRRLCVYWWMAKNLPNLHCRSYSLPEPSDSQKRLASSAKALRLAEASTSSGLADEHSGVASPTAHTNRRDKGTRTPQAQRATVPPGQHVYSGRGVCSSTPGAMCVASATSSKVSRRSPTGESVSGSAECVDV